MVEMCTRKIYTSPFIKPEKNCTHTCVLCMFKLLFKNEKVVTNQCWPMYWIQAYYYQTDYAVDLKEYLILGYLRFANVYI